jgi:hypothetical protein
MRSNGQRDSIKKSPAQIDKFSTMRFDLLHHESARQLLRLAMLRFYKPKIQLIDYSADLNQWRLLITINFLFK